MSTKPAYKLLRVDLTRGTTRIEEIDEALMRKFLGGSGLSTRIISGETTKSTEPLSEENVLIFSIGPVTGTPVPSSSRIVVAGISPQTNIWGEAHAGGRSAAALQRTGFMAVVITGKAKKPSYLWVREGEAKIMDASHLWGTDSFYTYETLLKETDPRAGIATIGAAGENLVPIACVMCDGNESHVAGRCGIGAIMGSKNLKAFVASGNARPQIFNDVALKESINRIYPKLKKPEPGQASPYFKERHKILDERAPVKNFQLGGMPSFAEKQRTRVKAAYAAAEYHFCPHCRNGCLMPAMMNGKRLNHGEATLPMGTNCLIDDFDLLDEGFEICNKAGLDTISAGDIIAFAMELYEKGLLTKKDCEGIELTWGNGYAENRMLEKIIANQPGIGKLLGKGVKEAAEEIGGEALECAINVKGLEPSLHDPRAWNLFALQNATGNRGADHMDGYVGMYDQGLYPAEHLPGYAYTHLDDPDAKRAYLDPFATDGVGKVVAWSQNFTNMIDSVVTCNFIGNPALWIHRPIEKFAGVQPEHMAEWLSHITGWDVTGDELMTIGERIFNMKRMFSYKRAGITRKDDILPVRLLTSKRGGVGPACDNLPHLGRMLNEYYAYRGWSEYGIPTQERLTKLGI